MSKIKYSDGSNFHDISIDMLDGGYHSVSWFSEDSGKAKQYLKLGTWSGLTRAHPRVLTIEGAYMAGWNSSKDQPHDFKIAVEYCGYESYSGDDTFCGLLSVFSGDYTSSNQITDLAIGKPNDYAADIYLVSGSNGHNCVLYTYHLNEGIFTPSNDIISSKPSNLISSSAIASMGMIVTA